MADKQKVKLTSTTWTNTLLLGPGTEVEVESGTEGPWQTVEEAAPKKEGDKDYVAGEVNESVLPVYDPEDLKDEVDPNKPDQAPRGAPKAPKPMQPPGPPAPKTEEQKKKEAEAVKAQEPAKSVQPGVPSSPFGFPPSPTVKG